MATEAKAANQVSNRIANGSLILALDGN